LTKCLRASFRGFLSFRDISDFGLWFLVDYPTVPACYSIGRMLNRSAKVSVHGVESAFRSRAHHESESQISLKMKKTQADANAQLFGKKVSPIFMNVQGWVFMGLRIFGFALSYLAFKYVDDFSCFEHSVNLRSVTKVVVVALLVTAASILVEIVIHLYNFKSNAVEYRESWSQIGFALLNGLVSLAIFVCYMVTVLQYSGCSFYALLFCWLVLIGNMTSCAQLAACVMRFIGDSQLIGINIERANLRLEVHRRELIGWVMIFNIIGELCQLKYIVDNDGLIPITSWEDYKWGGEGGFIPAEISFNAASVTSAPSAASSTNEIMFYVSLAFYTASSLLLLCVLMHHVAKDIIQSLESIRKTAGTGSATANTNIGKNSWVSTMPLEAFLVSLAIANMFLLIGFGTSKMVEEIDKYLLAKGTHY
jgi:hypothetical protein